MCAREIALRRATSTTLVTEVPLTELIFGLPAITATFDNGGTLYANPKCIVRARVYHSMSKVKYPAGLWCAEADEI